MEKSLYELKIDPEFEKVAPPLSMNELELLEEDVLEHGCIAPLIVWNDVIVDGHNRYTICHANEIPFAIEEIHFEDRTEAKLWVLKNQLGRRNLQPFQRCEMIAPMEKEIKADAEKRRRAKISETLKNGGTVPKVAPSTKSRDVIAKLAGVSHTTYGRAKVIMENADDETKAQLRSNEVKIGYVFNKMMHGRTDKGNTAKDDTTAVPILEKSNIQAPVVPEFQNGLDDKPPVVAAHLDHPIPFVPVQTDEKVEAEFEDMLGSWSEDVEYFLESFPYITEDLSNTILNKLDTFYNDIRGRITK